MNKTNLKSYVFATIAMIVWSSSFILTQIGLNSFPPVMLVMLRIILAETLLFIVGVSSRTIKKIDNKKDFFRFLITGFTMPFAYFVFEAYGLTQVSPTVASVVLSTVPVFTPLFALFMLKEKISWIYVLGSIISLFGVIMVLFNKNEELRYNIIGLILLLGAVAMGIVYNIFLKKMPEKYSNISVIFYIHVFSLLFFIPMFFIVDVRGGECLQVIQNIGEREFLKSITAVLVLAIFSSVLSYVLFASAVRTLGPTKAGAFNNLMPVITALIMWVVFSEQLSWVKWSGIVIVILGLYISQIKLSIIKDSLLKKDDNKIKQNK